jgi:hypothetical protein
VKEVGMKRVLTRTGAAVVALILVVEAAVLATPQAVLIALMGG